ncbi:hypothetical protein [uncultured Cyclobacterium sp.]|uniref:ArnT family glycosyltransferase n=1 Tax=uncultured Cyclobacterium sp. TaxID=453820 RepID=UPI0030EBF798|tara:strand:+ start:14634 stop:16238 length:1605 start_codon:yes stop_codon:yes gene_type:complete
MNNWIKYIFLAYLLFGTILVGDYGLSMDEPVQRKHGIVAFEYVNELIGFYPDLPNLTVEHLPNYDHRDYGMLFQMVAYGLELALGIDNTRDIFRLRHLMVFVLFWAAAWVFYGILYRRFKSVPLALAGVLMLVLSPRIFGNSMYNPKDIPLLCWFVFAFYTHTRFMDKKDKYGPVLHGLACALAIGSRVVGVVWPLISLGYLLCHVIFQRSSKTELMLHIKRTTFYLLFLLAFTFILWPVLWEEPIGGFIHSFNSMKQFRWYAELLYLGEMVQSTELPWHYIPVLISVTTPLAILSVICSGLLVMFRKAWTYKLKLFTNATLGQDTVALGAALIPLLAVILFGSVLYNGWRHLYFIYPFLVYLGVLGIDALINVYRRKRSNLIVKIFAVGLLGLATWDIGNTVYFLIRYHPHQSVYFNFLAGDVEKNFERDYYGMSYKEGLSKLLERYPDKILKIYSLDFIGRINTMVFPKHEAERLVFVDSIEEAEFFMTLFTFRSRQEYQKYNQNEYPYNQPIDFAVKVKDYRTLQVYRLEQ